MSKTSRKDLTTAARGVAVVGRRRRRGTLLIALGLVVAAGAVALVANGKKRSGGGAASPATTPDLPPVERRDALAAESAGSDVGSVPTTDDAVGDVERKVDDAITGKPALPEQPEGPRRGRHAAKE